MKEEITVIKKEKKVGGIFFDARVYSPEALSLAAVVFSGRLTVDLKGTAQGMTAVFGCGADSLAGLRGEFINEALNQQCRMDLGRKNSRLARIVITKALLSAADSAKGRGKPQGGVTSQKRHSAVKKAAAGGDKIKSGGRK